MAFRDYFFFRRPKEAERTSINSASLFREQDMKTAFFHFFNSQFNEDEILRKIGGYHKLHKLTNDDEICAALDTRLNACESTPWSLVGGDESIKERMSEILKPHIKRLTRSFWSAVPFGYSVTEIIYERSNGQVEIGKILEKPIEWYRIYPDGTKTLRFNFEEEQEVIPFKYIFTVRKPTYHCPMGSPILSKLYWAYIFRCHGWEFWFKYIERFANPFLYGKTHGTEEDIKRMMEALDSARQSSVIVTDKESDVGLLQSLSKGNEFKEFEQALIERIQKVILGQTLTSQMSSTGGSFAAASVHNAVREDKRRADCKLVEESFNDLIRNLASLNRIQGELPEFKLEDPKDLDIERARRDAILVNSGMIKLTEQYIMDRFDYEEGDFELVDSSPELGPLDFHDHDHHIHHPSIDDKYKFVDRDFGDDELEKQLSLALESTSQVVNIDKIKDVVLASRNSRDLAKNLSRIHNDDDGRYIDNLTNALMAAKIIGYLDE